MREILINSSITVISAFVIGLLTYGYQLLAAKIKTQKEKAIVAEKTALATTFTAVENILNATVSATVGKIEQVTAKDLREAVRNGKANREELTILASDAYYEVLDSLKPEIVEQLKELTQSYENYIKNKIEDAVRKIKLEEIQANQYEFETVDDTKELFCEPEAEVVDLL